ncbi:ABC transporter permease [Rhizomonospora bruguierae]|uniref:ABC transporter permease n=1 Tax=Rhizomonospora bruguierae TaxID=1581705 RepID=UPI001BD1B322|nr:ABC transporter permease [Micromonospora sp. NBRC 107566]
MNGVLMVGWRELALQLRSKGFLIGALASVVIVVAAVAIPTIVGRDSTYRIGLVGRSSQVLAAPIQSLADGSGVQVHLSSPADESAARAALSDGDLDAVVIDDARLLADGPADRMLAGLIQGAHQAVHLGGRLAELGLSDGQIESTLRVAPLSEVSVANGDGYEGTRQAMVMMIMLVLLFLFMTAPLGVAAGVVEEKSSRIVESLFIALRPWQLLTGKLFAFGLLGLIQLTVVVAAGLGTALSVGLADDLPPGMPGIIGITYVAYVFGFLLYGAMAAALGSLVARQEETNSALGPVTAAVVLSYLAAFVVSSQPGLAITDVLTILPPVSTFALPVQIASGQAAAWQVVAGLALLVLAIIAVIVLGARIFERSVLRTGGRIKILEAIKG